MQLSANGSGAQQELERGATGKRRGQTIRVGVVDDYDIVRVGLEKLFMQQAQISLVATARDGLEALDLVVQHRPDVLVLDIAMPGCGAVDILEKLIAARPEVKVLIFTGYPEQRYALPLARLGASGYLDKAAPLEEIIRAVKAVAEGGTYFSPRIESLIKRVELSRAPGGDSPNFTAREFQIFLRLAAGDTVRDIALALGLSDVTISSHRARLLRKLKLSSNSHLTRYAVENGFLH
jgi:two-component system invasion response regulator UvrY